MPRPLSAAVDIEAKAAFFIPTDCAHPLFQPAVFGCFVADLVLAVQDGSHAHEESSRQCGLSGGVNPGHMAVVLARFITAVKPRHIIHAAAKAAAEVGAILPGPIHSQPPVVGEQDGKNTGEAVFVTAALVITPFAPGQQIWARAIEIVRMKLVGTARAQLTGDKAAS